MGLLAGVLFVFVYNLNVPRRSDRRKHGQTSRTPSLLTILHRFSTVKNSHVAHANRHLQIYGTSIITKNKNYQPTHQDVNLYNHILDFNGDGRVNLEDFESLAIKYLAKVEKK